MKKLFVVVFAVALVLGLSMSARADMVTFDDAYSNSILDQVFYNGQSFSDGALTFTNHGTYMGVWDSTNPNGNGTNSLILAGFNTGDYLSITKTGGGAFDLNSIDMSISWYDGNPSETITVNGSPIGLGQGIQTYALNLNNVTEVDISGVPSNSGYWLADNVEYDATPTPIPGAALLFGPGLAGLAVIRRRFKK